MDKEMVIKSLQEAAKTPFKDLPDTNPFKDLGFDDEKARLGWVILPGSDDVRERLEEIKAMTAGKKYFVFAGMGGSINGIKALIQVRGKTDTLKTLDTLDPGGLEEILQEIELDKTLVIPISKSGTTKETIYMAGAFREVFKDNWKDHFLWLADPSSFEKLDKAGWEGVKKVAIQVDAKTDIGGRFSCPYTMIFLIPLYLIWGDLKDLKGVVSLWEEFLRLRNEVVGEAFSRARSFSSKNNAYFAFKLKSPLDLTLRTWLVQLFQESMGSKKAGFAVKTIVFNSGSVPEGFGVVEFIPASSQEVLDLMLVMCFLHYFCAFFSCDKGINFVTQEYVEKYKKEMNRIAGQPFENPPGINLKDLVAKIKARLDFDSKKFIEIVFFWHASPQEAEKMQEYVQKEIPRKRVFVFSGSDWNHHSYQAAFRDEDTLFVLLVKEKYPDSIRGVSGQKLQQNTQTLQTISLATYNTIKDKSLYYTFIND